LDVFSQQVGFSAPRLQRSEVCGSSSLLFLCADGGEVFLELGVALADFLFGAGLVFFELRG
jgi:hypothetical protein